MNDTQLGESTDLNTQIEQILFNLKISFANINDTSSLDNLDMQDAQINRALGNLRRSLDDQKIKDTKVDQVLQSLYLFLAERKLQEIIVIKNNLDVQIDQVEQNIQSLKNYCLIKEEAN